MAFVLQKSSCLAEVEVTFEAQDGLFEAVPEEGGEADGGRHAYRNNRQIARDTKRIKRLIHVAAEDGKDKDVSDVETVADFPDKQEWPECKDTAVERGTGAT